MPLVLNWDFDAHIQILPPFINIHAKGRHLVFWTVQYTLLGWTDCNPTIWCLLLSCLDCSLIFIFTRWTYHVLEEVRIFWDVLGRLFLPPFFLVATWCTCNSHLLTTTIRPDHHQVESITQINSRIIVKKGCTIDRGLFHQIFLPPIF